MRIKLFLTYNLNMSAKQKTTDILELISKGIEKRDAKFYKELLTLADREIYEWQKFKKIVEKKMHEKNKQLRHKL